MKPITQIFWFRVIMGITVGIVSGIFGFVSDSSANGILLAAAVYIPTYYYARYLLPELVGTKQYYKLLTTGLWNYIMIFLFTWILYNTFSVSI